MIDYSEEWLVSVIFRKEGSVFLYSAVFAFPSAIIAVALPILSTSFPEEMETAGFGLFKNSILWASVTGVLTFVVGFRTSQAFARFWEGTGLLHRMKGEWFDTVSNCITFTIHTANKDPSKRQEVEQFRHTLVRLMSLCHGSALEEISGINGRLEAIDSNGLNRSTQKHIKECVDTHGFNKVEVLVHLVQSVITDAREEGVIQIAPPILSRVYQTLSRGYVNLLNTKKITDTKFPFPYAQAIALLLFVYTLLTPLVMTSHYDHSGWAPLFSFVPVFGLYALNAISIELENPFGEDDNDLPLAHFQSEMNRCLLMLMHPNTDIIAGLSNNCILDFEELKSSVNLDKVEPDEAEAKEIILRRASKGRRMSNVHLFDTSFDPSALDAPGSHGNPNKQDSLDVSSSPQATRVRSEECLPSEGGEGGEGGCAVESPSAFQSMLGPGERLQPLDALNLQDAELKTRLLASSAAFNTSLNTWRSKMEEQVREVGLHAQHIRSLSRRSPESGEPYMD